MLEILKRIVEGRGEQGDIERLERLGSYIKETAQCGLGQTAPNPVLTTIKYFRHEYEEHIANRRCPAHSCMQLVDYMIDPATCTGCTVCARNCPAGAISGEKKQAHQIDQAKCIKCGKCITMCNFGAIMKD